MPTSTNKQDIVDLMSKPREEYDRMTGGIQELLSSQVGVNPAVTNFFVNLVRPWPREAPLFGRLTNLPNTLVIQGHGSEWAQGLTGGDNDTNELAKAVMARRNLALDKPESEPRQLGDPRTLGALRLGEIAKSLAGATNDVKRVVLMACYRAGYSPAEIKAHFPNVEQIIASNPDSSTSPGYLEGMFNREPNPWDLANPNPYQYTTNATPKMRAEDWQFRNYQGGKTNPIYRTSDWLPNPPTNFPYFIQPETKPPQF